MHIVHVITRFIRGGADENTLLTCNGQAEAGHKVTLICGAAFDPTMQAELHSDIAFIIEENLVRPIHPLKDARCYLNLKKLLKKLQPDVVHTHESKAGIIGRLAAKHADVPKIVHGVHILAFMDTDIVKATLFKFLERYVGRFTDAFVHVSPAMQAACKKNNIGNNSQHVVVPSGMKLERYETAKPIDLAKRLKLPEDSTHYKALLMSGTLEKRKRVAEFVAAFAEVKQAVPEAILLVGGDGAERKNIELIIQQKNLQDSVFLLGYTTELPGWIAATTLCVHMATHEGLPRVIIQYLAAGKPVVATQLDGLDSILTDGKNGFITQKIPDAVKKITAVLQDDALYSQHERRRR